MSKKRESMEVVLRTAKDPADSVIKLKQPGLLYSFLATTYSSGRTPHSTIGAVKLNFRVRHGTGCDLDATTTRKLIHLPYITSQSKRKQLPNGEESLDALVPVSSTPLNAYTPGLSNRSSSGHLTSLSE